MPSYRKHLVFAGVIAGALFLQAHRFAPVEHVRTELPPDSVARAVETGNKELLDLSLKEGVDVNGRDQEGRTALMVATVQRNQPLIQRLLDGGANVDLGDSAGLTPLMVAAKQGDVELVRAFLAKSTTPDAPDATGHSAAHHAIAARQPGTLELLLPTMRDVHLPDADGRDLLTLACDTGDLQLIGAVLARANSGLVWNPSTRSALRTTITSNQPELTRALLSKHAGPPTLDGSDVPLIVHAVVSEDIDTLKALLSAGADPNVPLPPAAGKDYAKVVTSSYLRSYVVSDQGVTPLMLAAGQERTDILGTLLQAGADKNRHTAKHKMMALYFAARTRNAKAVQMLLGRGPSRDELRVEISLATQKATLYKNGAPVLNTAVSTGRKGFDTPAGEYVVTDKKRSHRSSIYHVEMPFFMRLNCLDFGLHAGAVPNYPASHGCVRVPASMAEKLFSEVPVGTVVTIN